jgi:hypothetical protein
MVYCHCIKKSGQGVTLVPRKGFVPVIKKKKAVVGGEVLLGQTARQFQPNAQVDGFAPESKKFFTSTPSYSTGKGIKTELQRVTDKLDKLVMSKPKQVKKNIRVSL